MTDTPKSCANCPSFLQASQTPSKFGQSVGAPLCATYGHILGKPGLPAAQEKKIQEQFAKNCDSYGEPVPPVPVRKSLAIVMPDMDARVEEPDENKRNTCTTCATCKNYVTEDTVASELGFTAGVCAAKGKLILATQRRREAQNCDYRSFGQVRRTMINLTLLPEYDKYFAGAGIDPVRSYFADKAAGFVEPHDYVTDKEVTVEDELAGIRAWIAVEDPDGSGQTAYLPSYRPDFFSEEERAKIPRTGDDEHPELYIDHFGGTFALAVAWTELDETPALWGEAGVGKTELGRYLAWRMCLPYYRFSITASTEVDHLAGSMRYTPEKGTYFQYGRLVKAWAKPCVMVIDEPNVAEESEVWHFFRPMFDNSKQLVLDMNDGEEITRHTDCYPILAMNPAWDVKNVGALQISDADANRLWHIRMELPPEALEREIIANRVKLDGWELSDEQLNLLITVANEARQLANEGQLPISWAIRPQIKVARALRWFSPMVAYRRAAGDYLEPEAEQILLDIVKSHYEVK